MVTAGVLPWARVATASMAHRATAKATDGNTMAWRPMIHRLVKVDVKDIGDVITVSLCQTQAYTASIREAQRGSETLSSWIIRFIT